MGVYIKGMEMPKSCYECWALDDDYDYPMCRITQEQRGYSFNTRGRKMAKCPLINVLEPHGRLIDAEMLMEYCNNTKAKNISNNDIARFPTVIGRSNK